MATWNQALKEGLLAGSLASVLSTLVLALVGRRETGHAAAPTNAISHWLWRGESLGANQLDLRHTATGYLIHHTTSVFWATLYSRVYGQRPGAKAVTRALPACAAASAVACWVDYQLTPPRLQPGFEKRLSTPAMVAVYSTFALGLALGNLVLAGQATRRERRKNQDRRRLTRRTGDMPLERRRWRAGAPVKHDDLQPSWRTPAANAEGSGNGQDGRGSNAPS